MAPVRWVVIRTGVISVVLGRHVSGVRGGWLPCQPKTQSSLDLVLSRVFMTLRQLSLVVSFRKLRLMRKRRLMQNEESFKSDGSAAPTVFSAFFLSLPRALDAYSASI